jgi:ATP-dependent exoDNAse (exonuclease V) alpha subunit
LGPALNEDQAGAVRQLASSGRGVDAVQALAGTGKTTMIGALAGAYQQAGWRVVGAAPTGRAARELRDVAAIPAATMHSLAGELDSTGGFRTRSVLVIDEAGMAATRVTAQLFAHAERARCQGDRGRRLRAAQFGRGRRMAGGALPPPAGAGAQRGDLSPGSGERRALQALHDGQPAAYLQHKQDDLSVHDSECDGLAAVVDQWDGARCEYGLGGR